MGETRDAPGRRAELRWRGTKADHRLMITHEVTNVESDRAQLAHMAEETRATLEATNLDVIADRGYFSSEQILACGTAHKNSNS